uniref:Uncharacterized protein n=2 Tax=Clytia hemisphaerica TaxID=252671 RepID=A0A7M5UM81_9CNID
FSDKIIRKNDGKSHCENLEMDLKWYNANKTLILYTFSFTTLYFLFGFLWTIVLLITLELLENNLEFNINTEHSSQIEEEQQRNTVRIKFSRKYTLNREFMNNTDMFGAKEQQQKSKYNLNGDAKPSLMTLIKHGSRSHNKENREKQQPLLAVVKNNLHLRRSQELSNISKSPLYKNLIPSGSPRNTSFGKRSSVSSIRSPSIHGNSGWLQSPKAPYQSPVMSPSVSLSRSSIYDQKGPIESPTPSTGSLEVHGSYFINKSLLHSNLVEEEQFSLVNSQFNSPRNSLSNFTSSNDSFRRTEKAPILDETSTEAVMSILKEKSKRKRIHSEVPTEDEQRHSQSDETSRKKIKFDRLDDTMDDLLPRQSSSATTSTTRKRINSKNVIITKKRLASIGVQCDEVRPKVYVDMEWSEKEATTAAATNASKKRSKYGLSDEQTDEMLGDELEESPLPKKKLIITDSTKTESRSEATFSQDKSKVTFDPNITSKGIQDEIDFHRTPMKQHESIKEIKQSSALKSLKSPYKKLFHTFPSNLTPGSAEKRRKHPVYFTAKIDVDDIQSNREEFGDRGASLKAFRMDQEEAQRRASSMLGDDETDGAPSSESTSSTIKAFTALQQPPATTSSLPTFKITTTTSLASDPPPKSTIAANKLSFSFSVQPPTLATSTITSTATIPPTTSKEDKITPKKSVTFSSVVNYSIVPASASSSTTTPATGFSFNTPVVSTSQPAPSIGFSFNKPATDSTAQTGFKIPQPATTTSTRALNFDLGNKNTAGISAASLQSAANQSKSVPPPSILNTSVPAPSFSFGAKPASASVTSQPVTGFNLPSSTPVLPSFAAATATANVPSIPTFGSTSIQASSAPSANPIPSFSLPSNTSTTASASVFGTTSTATANPPVPSFNFGASAKPGPALGAPALSTSQPAAATQASIFGNTAKLASSGFSFNATAASTATTNTGFSFGATSQTSAPSSQSVFGTQPPSTLSVFAAAPTTTTAASANIFGNQVTQNVFAAAVSTTTTASTNIFGNTQTQNVFAAAALSTTASNAPAATTNIFGNQQPSSQNGFPPSAAPVANSVFGKPAAQTTGGFNFSNTTNKPASSTGFSFGTPNSQTTSGAVFGAPQNQTTAFQTASSAPVFGQTTTTTQSSTIFGKPTATTTPFGQTQNSAGSVFGQPSSAASVFGAQPASTNNVFGNAQNSTASVFGNTSSAAPTPFGSSTNTAGSVFGNTSNAPVANPFGQASKPATNPTSGGFNFGGASTGNAQPSFNFGGASSSTNNNVFGAPSTPAKPSFNFGGGAQPSFGGGAPSTPSFGTPQQPSFGTPQPFGAGTPSFNSPAAPAGGGFTIGASGNQSGRQTQRARRRIKR